MCADGLSKIPMKHACYVFDVLYRHGIIQPQLLTHALNVSVGYLRLTTQHRKRWIPGNQLHHRKNGN